MFENFLIERGVFSFSFPEFIPDKRVKRPRENAKTLFLSKCILEVWKRIFMDIGNCNSTYYIYIYIVSVSGVSTSGATSRFKNSVLRMISIASIVSLRIVSVCGIIG